MKAATPDFGPVFARLKRILQTHQRGAFHGTDKPGNYTLIGPATTMTRGRPLWFGAVVIQKRYVSYHLMPVYGCRELMDDVSAELKKRMQGKACFNFTEVDEALFAELADLTARGYKRFKKLKYIP